MSEALDIIWKDSLNYLDISVVIKTMKQLLAETPENIPNHVYKLSIVILNASSAFSDLKDKISPNDMKVARALLAKLKVQLKKYEKMPPVGGTAFNKINGISA